MSPSRARRGRFLTIGARRATGDESGLFQTPFTPKIPEMGDGPAPLGAPASPEGLDLESRSRVRRAGFPTCGSGRLRDDGDDRGAPGDDRDGRLARRALRGGAGAPGRALLDDVGNREP